MPIPRFVVLFRPVGRARRFWVSARRVGSLAPFVCSVVLFSRPALTLWGTIVLPALPADGAGPGIVPVAGIEIWARAGGVGDGLLRRLAVRSIHAAGDGAAVVFQPQEQRVRVHRARLQVRARVGGAGVVPAEVQVWRELASGALPPLARIADDTDLLTGLNLRADLQGALLLHVRIVEEVALLDRSRIVGGFEHNRVAAEPVPTVLVRSLHRDEGAVGDRELRRPSRAHEVGALVPALGTRRPPGVLVGVEVIPRQREDSPAALGKVAEVAADHSAARTPSPFG